MDNYAVANRMLEWVERPLQICLMIFSLVFLTWNTFVFAQDPPPAGSVIGNQATATYTDEGGTSRTVTSNLVQTVVQQVAGMNLVPDLTKTASPGGQVVFPHTLTNTGNGTDRYALTFQEDGSSIFSFTDVTFYTDANRDGIPDNSTAITQTTDLSSGASFSFVVIGVLPVAVTQGDENIIIITATSNFDAAVNDQVTDVTTVSGNAVINLTKNMSADRGDPGSGPHRITFTYTNAGNSTATDISITDALPNGIIYVLNSARWSESGSIVLSDDDNTDVQGTAPNTIVYDFGVTAPGQLTAQISQVEPGQSGTLTFEVTIENPFPAGALTNIAIFSYNDGTGSVGPFESNQVPFDVNQVAVVSAVGDTIVATSQGGTLYFENIVTNNGNAVDVFNVTFGNSTFPAGTSTVLLNSDGLTPLLDSNGDGIPDTGPLAPGNSDTVIVQIILPGLTNGGPYELEKKITSVYDPTVSVIVNDVLQGISPNTVDLTNNSSGAGSPGEGPGPELNPVTTLEVDPGAIGRFSLFISNTSSVTDNYDLSVTIDPTLNTISLPANWNVIFRDTSEAVITNTGNVAAGNSIEVYADVVIPQGAEALIAPGQSLFFQIISQSTGAQDSKHDAVVINTLRQLNLVPNHTGQVFPGGTVVYPHTLTNNGNVRENTLGSTTLTFNTMNSLTGWNTQLYLDSNGDGVLDAGDQLLLSATDLGALDPGEQIVILVKVTSPASAVLSEVNATDISVVVSGLVNGTPPPSVSSVRDVTTVILGNVSLEKTQAIDTNCDGIADTPYVSTTLNADPGQCVLYRVVMTNLGLNNVTNVIVSDAIPSYTTFFNGGFGVSTDRGSVISQPADGGRGTVVVNVGTLVPGQSATVDFSVKIDE